MLIHPDSTANLEKDFVFRFRYETLRSLLNKNGGALQLLSDLEADLNHLRHYDKRIQRPIRRLITEALLMAQELNLMTGDRHLDVYPVLFHLRQQVDRLFSESHPEKDQPLVLFLEDPQDPDPALEGGKSAGIRRLRKTFKDLAPSGFVITTAAYRRILEADNLHQRIRILLNNLDVTEDQGQFRSRTRAIRRMLREAEVGEDIRAEVRKQVARFPAGLWAVRSSAVSEDGSHSFAGQFDSELNVPADNILSAYLNVLASRFSDRAVKYRLHHDFREIDTPMAVLCMPMVDAAAAGAAYTSDSREPGVMVISAVQGLADRMVRGEMQADTFMVSKGPSPEIRRVIPAVDDKQPDYLTTEKVLEIANISARAAEAFGHDLDIEWAVDKTGRVRFLQARRLTLAPADDAVSASAKVVAFQKGGLPVLEGGITIFPGRAEGPIRFLQPSDSLSEVPDGAIVLVAQPRPELAAILPKIAALLVMEGNPVGHLATLVREFSVPCIFRVGTYAKILTAKNIISVNATKRTVYDGIRWPGIRERVLARIAAGNRRQKKSGPLYDLVLALNLMDPDAPTFKARSCRSVHDTLRFMHEMSVRAMFGFGDKQSRMWNKKSRTLATGLPVKFQLIDLDRSVPADLKKVAPEQVGSIPFQALWRGVSDKRLFWPERWAEQMRGLPSDFTETVLGGNRGPRRASDHNYAIVATDYMNVNARLAYHYAMVDAMVGPGAEHNHVHFRFRGGGAGDENRTRRALFLERVLRSAGFGVDRNGDLVTAWFRRYPQADSETALVFLGRLMVCARQLDAALKTDASVKLYEEYFLNEQFEMFA